tara:strand:- start:144 stop:794 length:651 start_codon:yes stop_codon:yes gene_type:complete
MSEITHEGKTYILKSQVEGIVKERISKIVSRASEAERRAKEAESSLSDLQSRGASIDIISAQLEEYKTKLEASETRFNRYQSVSKYGITEPEIIEAIEYSYERNMKGKSKKDIVSLDDWISNHLKSPDNAPILLRPHLIQVASQNAPQMEEQPPDQHETIPPTQTQNRELISHNQNTIKNPPENQNLIHRGIKDSEFYRQNREAIKSAWLTKNRRR